MNTPLHTYALAVLCLCCTPAPPTAPTTVDLHLDADLPKPGSGCSRPTLPSARLAIEGVTAPCSLTVTDTSAAYLAAGVCSAVPTGAPRTLTLQWYVPGAREVLLAESIGRADLTSPTGPSVDVRFDSTVAQLRPKTKAVPTETTAEKTRFNCDRTGDDRCAGGVGDGGVTEQDTCSNFEEYCAGTLETVAIDLCP